VDILLNANNRFMPCRISNNWLFNGPMPRLLKSLILGGVIGFAAAFPSLAQGTHPAAETNAAAANPAPADQAPDDVMQKLSGLVHAGRYAVAQKLTEGLILAYPDDQRLIKAKALLDKAVASAKPAEATPSSVARPAVAAPSAQLTGMDKVEYNTLLELAREAHQTTDLAQQKTLLKQFMDDSRAFLQKDPEQMLVWQLRAATALSLDDITAGFEAGQKLLAAGAADSNDPKLQQLLAKLNLKGWLDEQTVKEAIAAFHYTEGKNHTTTLPNNGTLDLIWIAPGTFTMGSPDSKSFRNGSEWPQTNVTISKGFWLGKTLVTQGQYQALMGNNPSRFKSVGADAPVEQVSWNDAMTFCQKLTERERAAGYLLEGYAYTLPTEAQWEYACRAGTTEARYGNLDDIAWYASNSGSTTHPVAQKQPNAWGLYDMLGNVWEWCSDYWYGTYPGGNVTDPVGAPSGFGRVLRGGSWHDVAADCRPADRIGGVPGGHPRNVGFRLALAPSR
jgi:formylglycine-generating enzyme required for sulfatase activity